MSQSLYLPSLRLPSDIEGRAAIWRALYAAGYNWCHCKAAATLDKEQLMQYLSYPSIGLCVPAARHLRYMEDGLTEYGEMVSKYPLLPVNSVRHLIAALNAQRKP